MNDDFLLVDQVGSVPGMIAALEASKKYQNTSWLWCKAIIKPYNCY